jgi:hypothetical protein
MTKKILIVSIFATLMVLIPMTSAVDIKTDVKPLDEYTELISIIIGKGYGSGIIGGSVNLSRGDIFIIAYTTEGSYNKRTNQIYIEFFIGGLTQPSFGGRYIFGVAIGNIEW